VTTSLTTGVGVGMFLDTGGDALTVAVVTPLLAVTIVPIVGVFKEVVPIVGVFKEVTIIISSTVVFNVPRCTCVSISSIKFCKELIPVLE
jgi:hypothetical protein